MLARSNDMRSDFVAVRNRYSRTLLTAGAQVKSKSSTRTTATPVSARTAEAPVLIIDRGFCPLRNASVRARPAQITAQPEAGHLWSKDGLLCLYVSLAEDIRQ